ncbi:MAG TPA: hypothetical protein PKE30_11070 [Niabella sp.]|nr:hypothetical protein [Niabella sp.]
MKPINKNAQQIFNNLIQQLGNKDYLKLQSEGFMPLSFECIGETSCTQGKAKIYSLMHTFTQNGDLMRDPEMCFFYFEENETNTLNGAYPFSYRLDPLCIYDESAEIINGEIYVLLHAQRKHADFANAWLNNIKEQGFIK